MAARLSDDLRREICDRYQAGESSVALSAALEIGTTTVLRILRDNGVRPAEEAGVRPRVNQKLKGDAYERIVEEYRSGDTLQAIGDRHGVALHTVRLALKRLGEPRRRPGSVYTRASADQIRLMGEMWTGGMSQTKIAAQVGLTSSNVQRILQKAGYKTERRVARGERHGHWKGGNRVHKAGYYYVRLDPSDPLASMANISGYVFEHRLVMARSLGRPLYPWETVHHVDGDKGHNVIENLQLRVGRHGKHVVYECACCGSRDLRAVELA